MQIAGVSAVFPSRVVLDDDVLAMIDEAPSELDPAARRAYLDATRRLLAHAGTERRSWLAEGELAADLLVSAIDGALDDAGLARGDVDTFIYAGVSRGFLEPAESFIVARNAGLTPRHCFDVLEACCSFSRAALIAQSLLGSGEASRVLIAVGEFCVNGTTYVKGNFRPGTLEELEWRFPSYTLGECATAMVLTRGGERWPFVVRTRPELADLCLCPLPDAPLYAPSIQPPEPTRFFSRGRPMHGAALQAASEMWAEMKESRPDVLATARILFPHAPSRKLCDDWTRIAELPEGFIAQVFTRYGNIGSASVPVGLELARREGRIARGDRALCLVGAAGMSFMLYSFVY